MEGTRYLKAGAADELDPVTTLKGRDLRRVVTCKASPAGVGYGGGRSPYGRVGGQERQRWVYNNHWRAEEGSAGGEAAMVPFTQTLGTGAPVHGAAAAVSQPRLASLPLETAAPPGHARRLTHRESCCKAGGVA